jgi:hypothetical protein
MQQNLKWRILEIGIVMYLESDAHCRSYSQTNFEVGLLTFIAQTSNLSPL